MAEQRFNPEHILELAEELRLAGFDIGTQQQIAAQDLLIALAAHNRLPADPREWRSLLAPIFCASPTEQDEFYGRFDQWLDRYSEWNFIEDELTDPTRREIAIPAAAIHWLRKPVGMVSAALLILLLGFAVFLSLKTNRTLTGQVFSSDGDKLNPLSEAQVEFFSQPAAKTDRDGNFTIHYHARNWNRIFNRQVADLTVTHGEHDSQPPIKLDVHSPSHQTIKLQKRQPKTSDQTTITLPPAPEATPPPIPLLPEFTTTKSGPITAPNPIRWYHWLLIASPLILFAGWFMLRWRRRRALLQKLQAAGSPNLRRLTVRGASEHLFQSQVFRRAMQDLRCHRRVEVRDLDIPATVNATISRGGMFQPLYGARKALPEYLLLIDRVSPSDEQARFADELSHRLEAGGVFVDRFYFQNDPRTCRQREASSPMVTLLDLAARFPEHQLLIFSDGAGFISPLTGEAEPWVTMFSHWPRRVLLTPELASQPGYRELALAEHDFLVLPANDDGLFVLTETINTGLMPNRKSARNGDDNLFPRLILQERPKRWLERHEPRPAVLDELCDQLKRYLGEDGWHWLAACAVYPALSWDVTLYLGFKLFGDAEDFEERLLRLIRLPWFRYGSMPDWLRLRLIESFTPEQEATVRQTIESMLLSALDHPQEGIPLELAERQPTETNWWQRLKAKWEERRRKKRIADLLERQPEDSPLNDFVFLGFLSGNRTRRLTVKLPELLNRVLFPQGQVYLGLRPTTAGLAVVFMTGILLLILWPKSVKPNTELDRRTSSTPMLLPSPLLQASPTINKVKTNSLTQKVRPSLTDKSGTTQYANRGGVKVNPCPRPNAQRIWIKLKSAGKFLDGSRDFVMTDKDNVYYCVGDYLAYVSLKEIQEISFTPIDESRSSEQSQTSKLPEMGAVISSSLSFIHPTLSGIVIMEVELREDGTVGVASILKSSNLQINDLAFAEAKKIKFVPAIRDGIRISSRNIVTFQFEPKSRITPDNKGVVLISPKPNQMLKRTEKMIEFIWMATKGARFYRIQVEYLSVPSSDWHLLKDAISTTTVYRVDYALPYPGRWRVSAVMADGTILDISEWRHFTFIE